MPAPCLAARRATRPRFALAKARRGRRSEPTNKEKGHSIESIESKILAFLARYPNEQFKAKELARRLGIRAEQEYEIFKLSLRKLQDERRIDRVKGKQFCHMHVAEVLDGVMELSNKGFGVVAISDSSEEIFVRQNNLGEAGHGDQVRISILPQSQPKKDLAHRREGEVVEVLKRNTQTVVGKLERNRKTWFVVPDDSRFGKAIVVPTEHVKNAEEGYKVAVQLDSWGRGERASEGRIVEVFGSAGEMHAELRSVLREFGLPTEYPREVLAEANGLPGEIPLSEIERRLDMRKTLCVTIDPVDAKDFDDAVSFEKMDNGNYWLGVHIADVSWYVHEHTLLDAEALKRGTSVYIPNGVIPMLPERLSNHLCSLRPNEDKLTFSVLMEITPRGSVKRYEIRETVIHSKRRFTYEEVQEILFGPAVENATPEEMNLHAMVRDMHELSSVLTKKRLREGSIDFESAEAKFRFDADGNPVEIVKKVRLDSHRLVEEFMLLANKVVAGHIGLSKKEEHPKPFIYRVHDSPDPDRIEELAAFVE
ncbi:MAG: RNB domain-containing ribonuclease, partial [Ignavibacteriales bacterium]|nr:RNB domain-containing ribonuclease [Ignavibacteriales bacterium]